MGCILTGQHPGSSARCRVGLLVVGRAGVITCTFLWFERKPVKLKGSWIHKNAIPHKIHLARVKVMPLFSISETLRNYGIYADGQLFQSPFKYFMKAFSKQFGGRFPRFCVKKKSVKGLFMIPSSRNARPPQPLRRSRENV